VPIRRTIRIASADWEVAVLAPFLIGFARAQMPWLRLSFSTMGRTRTLTGLAGGDFDIAFGAFPNASPQISVVKLYECGFRVAVRQDHPFFSEGADLATYLALEHVIVSVGGGTTDIVDELLGGRGLQRKVIAAVPFLLSALDAVTQGDLALTLPALVANFYAQRFGLKVFPMPIPLPPYSFSLAWCHDRAADDDVMTLVKKIRAIMKAE
jgi:DNA-binding transcriptional LysR family regulator